MECCLELLDRGLLVSLQDLGAAGLTSSSAEMASAGGVGIDIDVDRVPLREADMEPFEIMVSESQERMLAVVEPAQARRRARGLRAVADRRRADRRGHRHRPDPGARRRRGGRRRSRSRRWSTNARCMTWSPRSRPGGSTATASRSTASGRAAEVLPALLGSPNVASKRWAFEQYDSIVQSRTVRRPEAADAAVLALAGDRAGDRHSHRRQRAPRRLRPVSGHGRGSARVRPEPRLRRRGAPRGDQLPQLRQPGEAPRRLAARPLGAGPGRRVRGSRGPGRGRQRLPLQRDRARSDLSHARDRHGRRAPRPGSRDRHRAGPRATRSRSSARSRHRSRASSSPSSAATSTAGCRGSRSRTSGLRSSWFGTPSAPGAVSAAHDVSDGGLACALAECAIAGGVGIRADLDPLVELRGGSGESALFGEGAGGFVVAGPEDALRELSAEGERRGVAVLLGRRGHR